jgi:hypothetical protein
LDGKIVPCKKEVTVHFVAALIDADGGRVAFAEWVRKHSKFEGARSDRDLKIPKEIGQFIERGKGRGARLKVDLLR